MVVGRHGNHHGPHPRTGRDGAPDCPGSGHGLAQATGVDLGGSRGGGGHVGDGRPQIGGSDGSGAAGRSNVTTVVSSATTVPDGDKPGVLGRLVGQQAQHVGDDVEHGLQALHRPGRRAGGVEDQRPSTGAGHRPRQATQRRDQAHRLGQARGLAVEHHQRALGGQVAGPEAGATGGHHQPGEPLGQVHQRLPHRFPPVGHHPGVDHVEPGVTSRVARPAPPVSVRVPAATPSDTVSTLAASGSPPSCPCPRGAMVVSARLVQAGRG